MFRAKVRLIDLILMLATIHLTIMFLLALLFTRGTEPRSCRRVTSPT